MANTTRRFGPQRRLAGKVVELAKAGWLNEEIAGELNTTGNSVGQMLTRARKTDRTVPMLSKRWLALEEAERTRLDVVAAEIGVPPNRLAREIICRVLDEGLVAIVLGGDPKTIMRSLS